MAIMSGFKHLSIIRLEEIFQKIPPKYMKILNELNELMSVEGGHTNYRQELEKAPKPCLPYLYPFLVVKII